MSCSGTIGRVCEVPYNFKCVLVRSAALIKLNTNKCFSNFIEATLQSNIVQSQILVQQLQAAQPNLFQGAIKCLIFPLPSMKEQKRIAKSLIKFNSQISSKETRLEKLKLLKKGLMSDLLTGRVRVKI
ncbi:restriction endonuclease subunit S [Nostoc sp.]|uniref:restriction endonuclease subunit S n=1 Tax=Nostoc sp. TaxID=1180 RepID=UPI002FF78E14